jgi:hypothetical protein
MLFLEHEDNFSPLIVYLIRYAGQCAINGNRHTMMEPSIYYYAEQFSYG